MRPAWRRLGIGSLLQLLKTLGGFRRGRPAAYRDWLGLGKRAPENPRPRFAGDDDLWR